MLFFFFMYEFIYLYDFENINLMSSRVFDFIYINIIKNDF